MRGDPDDPEDLAGPGGANSTAEHVAGSPQRPDDCWPDTTVPEDEELPRGAPGPAGGISDKDPGQVSVSGGALESGIPGTGNAGEPGSTPSRKQGRPHTFDSMTPEQGFNEAPQLLHNHGLYRRLCLAFRESDSIVGSKYYRIGAKSLSDSRLILCWMFALLSDKDSHAHKVFFEADWHDGVLDHAYRQRLLDIPVMLVRLNNAIRGCDQVARLPAPIQCDLLTCTWYFISGLCSLEEGVPEGRTKRRRLWIESPGECDEELRMKYDALVEVKKPAPAMAGCPYPNGHLETRPPPDNLKFNCICVEMLAAALASEVVHAAEYFVKGNAIRQNWCIGAVSHGLPENSGTFVSLTSLGLDGEVSIDALFENGSRLDRTPVGFTSRGARKAITMARSIRSGLRRVWAALSSPMLYFL